MAKAKEDGLTELAIPKTIHSNQSIPVLGTGKLDLVTLKDIALSKLS